MARPQKNNCEYFPHLTTMRNHRKVKALRNKFGSILGYAFWAMFLEYLTELDGNEFDFTQIECEMFAAELGVSATEIQSLINFCIDIELLFKDESNFIYSDSLNDALKPVYEKRNRERGKSKARERHENGSFCKKEHKSHGVSATEIPQEIPLQQAETPQSKVKKSKEYYLSVFGEFRKVYPGKKRGNEVEFEHFTKKQKNWELCIELLKPAIEDQIKDYNQKVNLKQWVPEWPMLKTWISDKRWEMITEHIDEMPKLITQKKPDFILDMQGNKIYLNENNRR